MIEVEMNKKFSIKIEGKDFQSNEDGMLNLNDIWKGCALEEKKRPSEWKSKVFNYLKSIGYIKRVKNPTQGKGQAPTYLVGTEDAVIAYCKWANLPVESHGISLEVKRDEDFVWQLLLQIFPDIERQKPYKDGTYFVDFYVPSLDLNIEYDEKHHLSSQQRFKDAERELNIGGKFFRITQGKELQDMQILSKLYKNSRSKPTRYWVVDNKYFFTDEMSAYKFCVATGTKNIKPTRKPKFPIKEQKFICLDKHNYIFFPLIETTLDQLYDVPF